MPKINEQFSVNIFILFQNIIPGVDLSKVTGNPDFTLHAPIPSKLSQQIEWCEFTKIIR